MSYTKRFIDDLHEQDAQYDAEYMEFLRYQECDPEVVAIRKSDEIMPVTKIETEVELSKIG